MRFGQRFFFECLCIVALSGGLSACTTTGDDDSSGDTQTGTGGTGVLGTGGMTAAGTGGMTAGGTGGMTAGGTGGTTAGGTGGMTAGGTGGMTAGGTGGMLSDEDGGGIIGDGGGTGTPAEMCIAMGAAKDPPRTGACTDCGCNKCLDKLMNCTDAACDGIVACALKNHCKGRTCYCGDQTAIACATGMAMGPCITEIATAAGFCDMNSLDTCAQMLAAVGDSTSDMYDANNPVTRANAVGQCTQGQDAAPEEGGGIVPAIPAIMGMCETECSQ